MLHTLELENFKAFGKRAHIPFAPITLIFGENSAGKSSILQALNLLKQTYENRDTSVLLLPRAENGIVDLGNYREMIYDHNMERLLSIRVDTEVNDDMMHLPNKGNRLAIEFRFKRLPHDEEVQFDKISIYDGESSKRLIEFEPLNPTENPEEFSDSKIFFTNMLKFSPSKFTVLKCVWITADPEYWKSEYDWSKEKRVEILDELKQKLTELEGSHNSQNQDSEMLEEGKESLYRDIRFFSKHFELEEYISNRQLQEMNTAFRLQGFVPAEIRVGKRYPNVEKPPSLLVGRSYTKGTFNGAELVAVAYNGLESTLKNLFPIRPYRSPPQRWYTFNGTNPQNVGYLGNLLPDMLFRNDKLVKETNKWLEKLEINYKLDVQTVDTYSGELFEVRLIDTRRKETVNVALPDVGFGISQLLPFVVQSLASEKQIISIEQPEVHVHPRLQADLGNLFAEAIQKQQNQFIIETHSEHLILRLQRLVREKEIKPEDVSVIYISRKPEGAKAERLHLDEDGDFIDDWPNGFFPERLRELR